MVGCDSPESELPGLGLGYGAVLCIVHCGALSQLKTTMEKREQLLLDYDSYKRKVSMLLRSTAAVDVR